MTTTKLTVFIMCALPQCGQSKYKGRVLSLIFSNAAIASATVPALLVDIGLASKWEVVFVLLYLLRRSVFNLQYLPCRWTTAHYLLDAFAVRKRFIVGMPVPDRSVRLQVGIRIECPIAIHADTSAFGDSDDHFFVTGLFSSLWHSHVQSLPSTPNAFLWRPEQRGAWRRYFPHIGAGFAPRLYILRPPI